jgi:hypothetical protein
MATSSYANLFGTTGAGQQGSRAGIGTMFGQQPRRPMYGQFGQPQGQPRTFAQMQQQGQARPAPQFGGQFGQRQAQPPMLRQLQQQLQPMAGGGQQVTERQLPGSVATRGQAAPAFDYAAMDQMMAQQRQMAAQRQPQPQPTGAGGFAPAQGMLTAEQAGQPTPMMYSRAQPGMDVSAPDGGMEMAYSMGGAPQIPTQTSAAFEGLLSQLQEQLGQQFAQPSGYSNEEFQQLRSAQTGQLQAEFGAQQQALNEELARRGLSASSIGAGRMGDLAGQQARAMAGLEAQLLTQQAEAGQRGREQALSTLAQVTGQLGQLGLGQQEVGLRAEQIRQQGEQFGLQLSEQQADRMQRFGISTQELGLRAQQLQQEAFAQGRQMDITEAQNLAQNELEGRRIEQQQGQFTEQMRFNRDELALRGDLGRGEQQLAERRLQQEGRLEEARQGIQLKQLGQQEAQFTQTLSAEDRRFAENLKEQQAQRLQQLGISTRQLDTDAARLKQEADLQGRSLSLQQARDAAEVEYRTQSLQQQAALEGRRLTIEQARNEAEGTFRADQLKQQDVQFKANLGAEEQRFVRTLEEQRAGRLQQLGISTRQLDNEAARLKQDADLQGRSLTLQEARDAAEVKYRADSLAQQLAMQGVQITADEARQRAQIDFQRDQMRSDETLRREGFTVDRERINQAQRQFDASLAVDRERLAQAESQFGRSFGFQQGQAQQGLAMELARIFSASDNPQAAATIMPILQAMLAGLPGYGGNQQGNQQGGAPTATATATGPVGTVGPTGTVTPTAPAPAYTPPTATPYNNPLGPTGNPTTQMPNFDEILQFGSQSYNPYDAYGYDPYAGYGGSY